MAKFTVEKLPGEPIVLFTALEGYRISADLPASIEAAVTLINRQSQPVYYIQNLVQMAADMNEVALAANMLARNESPLYHHPNIGLVIVVTGDPTIKMAFQGMHSQMYGNLESASFDTLDEALEFARSGQ